jgi:hypothetical protein
MDRATVEAMLTQMFQEMDPDSETRYYAEPFEAPAWRADWVQRMPEE